MRRARYWLSWALLIPGAALILVAIPFILAADALDPLEFKPIVIRDPR